MEIGPSYRGYIEDELDALLLLEATIQSKLQYIPRRPYEIERPQLINSGNIFIFIEEISGIKRWTDGISWSPSRILGKFLMYRELNKTPRTEQSPYTNQKNGTRYKNKNPKIPMLPLHSSGVLSPENSTVSNGLISNESPTPQIKEETDDNKKEDSIPRDVENASTTRLYKYTDFIKKTLSVKLDESRLLKTPHTIHIVSYYLKEDVELKKLLSVKESGYLNSFQPSQTLVRSVQETTLGNGKLIVNKPVSNAQSDSSSEFPSSSSSTASLSSNSVFSVSPNASLILATPTVGFNQSKDNRYQNQIHRQSVYYDPQVDYQQSNTSLNASNYNQINFQNEKYYHPQYIHKENNLHMYGGKHFITHTPLTINGRLLQPPSQQLPQLPSVGVSKFKPMVYPPSFSSMVPSSSFIPSSGQYVTYSNTIPQPQNFPSYDYGNGYGINNSVKRASRYPIPYNNEQSLPVIQVPQNSNYGGDGYVQQYHSAINGMKYYNNNNIPYRNPTQGPDFVPGVEKGNLNVTNNNIGMASTNLPTKGSVDRIIHASNNTSSLPSVALPSDSNSDIFQQNKFNLHGARYNRSSQVGVSKEFKPTSAYTSMPFDKNEQI